MDTVILVVHLLLALALIAVVLLQRSEGGGLGIGGGGGGGGVSTRAGATALGKITWILAVAFICTSIALTVLSASQASDATVVGDDLLPPATGAVETPSAGESLLPPSVTTPSDEPLVPDVD